MKLASYFKQVTAKRIVFLLLFFILGVSVLFLNNPQTSNAQCSWCYPYEMPDMSFNANISLCPWVTDPRAQACFDEFNARDFLTNMGGGCYWGVATSVDPDDCCHEQRRFGFCLVGPDFLVNFGRNFSDGWLGWVMNASIGAAWPAQLGQVFGFSGINSSFGCKNFTVFFNQIVPAQCSESTIGGFGGTIIATPTRDQCGSNALLAGYFHGVCSDQGAPPAYLRDHPKPPFGPILYAKADGPDWMPILEGDSPLTVDFMVDIVSNEDGLSDDVIPVPGRFITYKIACSLDSPVWNLVEQYLGEPQVFEDVCTYDFDLPSPTTVVINPKVEVEIEGISVTNIARIQVRVGGGGPAQIESDSELASLSETKTPENKNSPDLGLAGRPLAVAGQKARKLATNTQKQEDGFAPLVNCFDHYTFGSIKFDNEAVEAPSFEAGSTLSFRVDVLNENDYPVADGMVFAKIYKEDPVNFTNSLVDEFTAVENINLWPKEQKRVTLNWAVPENTIGGRYKADLFFSTSKQFNLSGLSFTPTMIGKRIIFEIEGKEKGFWLDDRNVQFNGEKIIISSRIPTIKQGENISISVPLKNELIQGEATTSFGLYHFDLLNEENKLSQYSQTQNISLDKKEQPLEFNLSGLQPGAYIAKIVARGEGQQSILNVRFAIRGERGRFIFTGLNQFPLNKGNNYSIFSCFSNSADFYTSFNGKVDIQLKDQVSGEVIAQATYQGEITPQVMGIKQDFQKAPKNSNKLLLTSKLYNAQGNLVDEVETLYDIDNFTREELPPKKPTLTIFIIIPIILIVIVIIYFIIKKKCLKKPEEN